MQVKLRVFGVVFLMFVLGCAATRHPASREDELRRLEARLDSAEASWAGAVDDPYTEPKLRTAYRDMQCLCRRLHRGRGGFGTTADQVLCERVKYPFTIYFNKLQVEANRLKEQLFEIEKDGTAANEYMRRPSWENERKLKGIFDQVHRYYVGRPYTWHRYYNKYLFQRSRLNRFREEFEERDLEYLRARAAGSPEKEVEFARKRAEFAYRRLKEECVDNDLPFAGEAGPFYRSRSLDDYHEKLLEARENKKERTKRGLEKEVVIFIHGLGQGRACWGDFPTLLADDDLVDTTTDRYFKVYVFSYDTVEDSKSVEGFKNELAGFLDDIIEKEGVEKVSLIGHSFGGVLSLRYLVSRLNCPQEGAGGSEESAERILRCYLDGPFRQKVKRFIGIAPSLSGSHVANIAGNMFVAKKDLYRRNIPFFSDGIPTKGDIQVFENQIGSDVNLRSFERLDTERILDPPTLAAWAPGYDLSPEQLEMLTSDCIESLCIIGNPWHPSKLKRIGSDNFVKSYCANINQTFLVGEDASRDIGYQGSDVRYSGHSHFRIIGLESRKHPSYRYAVSFLKDRLIPQIEDGSDRIRKCMPLLRVFPAGLDARMYPDATFRPHHAVYYLPGQKEALPPIHIKRVERDNCNLQIEPGRWNDLTGAFFQEGSILHPDEPARITYELSAEGYRTKRVELPLKAGQITYAPYITLTKIQAEKN